MGSDYEEAEKYILGIPRFTKKNDMQATECFLNRLGAPGAGKKIIHIAGTNGKGSVCAYLSAVLREAGYTVGSFTSPHLVSMRERFRIDGKLVGENEFVKVFRQVRDTLGQEAQESGRPYHPTFFEYLFFMAMLLFEQADVDYIVLETGLGGRLDATNSVTKKEACVLTRIGLDHTEYLGDTPGQIAWEKAGIFRTGVPAVYWDGDEEASLVIRKQAREQKCPLFSVSKKDFRILDIRKNSIDFSFKSRYYGYVRFTLSTPALYQVENACLALRTLELFAKEAGITGGHMAAGIRKTSWEGRMEELLPGIYVDGAHNEDGIRAFLETVEKDGCDGKRFLLFSAVKEKRCAGMARLLIKSGLFSKILLTQMEHERGLTKAGLQELFTESGQDGVRFAGNVEEALRALIQEKGNRDMAYIAGSLYLAGQVKSLLRRDCNDKF